SPMTTINSYWAISIKKKGTRVMYLGRNEKYKKYNKISNYIYIGTICAMFFAIIASIFSNGILERSLAGVGMLLFVSGQIVTIIPDFLEKNIKKVILDTVLIVCVVGAFLVVWY